MANTGKKGMRPYRRKRLNRIRQLYLKGNSNLYELGAAFGVSHVQIHHDLKVIRNELLKEDELSTKRMRVVSSKRVEDVYREARLGFDRSRQDSEEIHYRERIEQCVACRGTGWKDAKEKSSEWCKVCFGEGEVRVGVTTTVRRGQAGDPAFLRVAQSCIAEMNKVNGLHTSLKPVSGGTIAGSVIHTQLGSADDRYLNAPMENIIEVKAALAKLLIEAKKRDGVVEGHVVNTEEDGG